MQWVLMDPVEQVVKELFEQRIVEQLDDAVYSYIAGVLISYDALEFQEIQ